MHSYPQLLCEAPARNKPAMLTVGLPLSGTYTHVLLSLFCGEICEMFCGGQQGTSSLNLHLNLKEQRPSSHTLSGTCRHSMGEIAGSK